MQYHSEKLQILIDAREFLQVLAQLIDLKQKYNANVSLNLISAKLGFKARSYLSGILSGRRKFPKEKITALADIFQLSHQEIFLLNLLYEWEQVDVADKCEIINKIKKVQSLLQSSKYLNSTPLCTSALVSEVFFTFLKFKSQMSRKEIYQRFPHSDETQLDRAVDTLIKSQLLLAHDDRIVLNSEHRNMIDFQSDMNNVKSSYKAAALATKKYFTNMEESIFGMTMISCDYDEYVKSLPKIRALCEHFLLDLEEIQEPDTLFRVNIAFYPIGKKSLKNDR